MTTTGTDTNQDAIQTPAVATGVPTPDNPDNTVDRIPPASAAQPPKPIAPPHVFVPPDASLSDTPLLPTGDASRIADLRPQDPNTVYVTAPQGNSALSQANHPAAVAVVDRQNANDVDARLGAVTQNNDNARNAGYVAWRDGKSDHSNGLPSTDGKASVTYDLVPAGIKAALADNNVTLKAGPGSIDVSLVDQGSPVQQKTNRGIVVKGGIVF
jgi:hypothetical protein